MEVVRREQDLWDQRFREGQYVATDDRVDYFVGLPAVSGWVGEWELCEQADGAIVVVVGEARRLLPSCMPFPGKGTVDEAKKVSDPIYRIGIDPDSCGRCGAQERMSPPLFTDESKLYQTRQALGETIGS